MPYRSYPSKSMCAVLYRSYCTTRVIMCTRAVMFGSHATNLCRRLVSLLSVRKPCTADHADLQDRSGRHYQDHADLIDHTRSLCLRDPSCTDTICKTCVKYLDHFFPQPANTCEILQILYILNKTYLDPADPIDHGPIFPK